ncbi:uncharacterized protein LOC129924414 isoform X2 [Biomphalaria glabrata]|uniref:Uncharacterized protein LOC129924414 isoform X2 n=1 Tax=Biomphalaria glabrata TaxID=6526 RepID=A0A9W2ZI38_BIOGL|nr:uncharacterized protein LOC129924414 isoform X2 [Biomphalaria glabrata]
MLLPHQFEVFEARSLHFLLLLFLIGGTLDNNLKIAVSTVLKVLFIRSPKIEDLNLSFKDYQKIFLQEDSFKKLYAVISKLQQENQNLLEKLNFMNHLEFKDHSCSKPPAVDCISEGEEEEESNLSLTTEKRDIDIQTDMNTANGLDEIRKCAMDKLEISQDRKSMDLVKQEKCVQQNNDQPKREEELLKDKLDELFSK